MGLSFLIVPGKKNALPLRMAKTMPLLFPAATPRRTRLFIPTFTWNRQKNRRWDRNHITPPIMKEKLPPLCWWKRLLPFYSLCLPPLGDHYAFQFLCRLRRNIYKQTALFPSTRSCTRFHLIVTSILSCSFMFVMS